MSLHDYLSVLRNPFSLATSTAKVPDGKVRLSMGEREQTNSILAIPRGYGVIILSPNFTVGQVNLLRDDVEPDHFNHNAVNFDDDGHLLDYPGWTNFRKHASAPDKWRLVSAGMRISLVNNSQMNDGWFEAIRVKSAYSPTNFLGVGAPHMIYEDPAFVAGGIGIGKSWANDPSYMRGKLSEIGNWTFYLQSSGTRDFKELPTSWHEDLIPVGNYYYFHNGSVSPGYIIDSNFDSVAIRVHSSSCEGTPETQIVIHTVHNFENSYDLSSVYAKHQTSSYNNPELVKGLDCTINRDPKPGRICLSDSD
jgi:hypothetical protein